MSKGRNTTVLGVRLPDVVYQRVRGIAAAYGVSLSEWVRSIVYDAIEQFDKEAVSRPSRPEDKTVSGIIR